MGGHLEILDDERAFKKVSSLGALGFKKDKKDGHLQHFSKNQNGLGGEEVKESERTHSCMWNYFLCDTVSNKAFFSKKKNEIIGYIVLTANQVTFRILGWFRIDSFMHSGLFSTKITFLKER